MKEEEKEEEIEKKEEEEEEEEVEVEEEDGRDDTVGADSSTVVAEKVRADACDAGRALATSWEGKGAELPLLSSVDVPPTSVDSSESSTLPRIFAMLVESAMSTISSSVNSCPSSEVTMRKSWCVIKPLLSLSNLRRR